MQIILIVFNNGPTTITNASNFFAYKGGSTTIIGDRNNNSSDNFTLYTTGTTTYRSVNNGTVRDFRHGSTNNVTIDTNATLQNGTIIIAQNNSQNINNLNYSNTSPFNLITNGTFTMRNMNLFVRSMPFADNSSVNIYHSLIYLYAYACLNCSRADSNSSLTACDNNINWCGWTGNSSTDLFTLNLGRGPNGEEQPVLIVNNNSTVRTNSPSGAVHYIWGAFVGKDVTYLRWTGATTTQNFRGFLIRNFPPNLTLNIGISGNFTPDFRKSIIDQLLSRY